MSMFSLCIVNQSAQLGCKHLYRSITVDTIETHVMLNTFCKQEGIFKKGFYFKGKE